MLAPLLVLTLSATTLVVVYLAVFALAGHFRSVPTPVATTSARCVLVLIPGYKEDAVIVETARAALQQDYPSDHFRVCVIADSFRPDTMERLRALPIDVVEVDFEKRTKVKALRAACNAYPEDAFDVAVVLDADNVMASGFLAQINAAFAQGGRVVQGHRVAKNLDTPLAVLDAFSEEVNNHIFRKGHRALGLSAALIGSGMAFEYGRFGRMMETAEAVGGFDKELELNLLREGIRIDYLDDALVYDEKVRHADAFVTQRTRWLAAQGHYFRATIGSAVRHLVRRGNIDFFDKAMQMLLPPRMLLAALMPALTAVGFAVHVSFGWWGLSLTVALAAALALSVPPYLVRAGLGRALLHLPRAFLLTLKALARSRTGNRTFLHTPHEVAEVTATYPHAS